MNQSLRSEAPSTASKKKALEHALRRRIITMQLEPGEVLDEVALCEEFGLSRSPVRELLRQMAGDGYIELEAKRAPRVTLMSYRSLREYYLVAPMIYIATTKLAAEKATIEDIQRLKKIQEAFRHSIENHDVDERVFSNNEFHYEIGIIARNDYLLPSLRRILVDHGRIGHNFFRDAKNTQEQLEASVIHHDKIIDAIADHDPEKAARIVSEHFDLSRTKIAAYAMPEPIEVPFGS